MKRTLLSARIQGVRVSGCDLNYVGSLTVDSDLLEAAAILAGELVHVLDIENGACFETYTIAGARGTGQVKVNGAAARLVHEGDRILVIAYATVDERQAAMHRPQLVDVELASRSIAS